MDTQEKTILGLIVYGIGMTIMTGMYMVGFANAPVKGCDYFDGTESAAHVEFCQSYQK